MEIESIIGLGTEAAKSLRKQGITTTKQLAQLKSQDLKELSNKTKIPLNLLDEWQEHAELMLVDGITPEYANTLNDIGVDSLKELSHRNADATLKRIIEYSQQNRGVKIKIPSLQDILGWIAKAQVIVGRSVKSSQVSPLIPKKSNSEDQKQNQNEEENYRKYGKYGPEYWNNKWEKAPIVYKGRALRGANIKMQIDADVKTFITRNDEILKAIIEQFDLKKSTPNETALACQQFVCTGLKYAYDEKINKCPDFWQFPFESVQSGEGDCEDGAILLVSLMINAGIPSWRCKVVAGTALVDPNSSAVTGSNQSKVGGHGWAIYLADRPDSERKLEWVILDWCYQEDPDVPCEKKPLARDGGYKGSYQDVWFTFNDEYSWSNEPAKITTERISKNRTLSKEQVLVPEIEDLVQKVFKDMGLIIEEKKSWIRSHKKYKI